MKVYFSLEDLPVLENTVVTIGSFDGVHRGHQRILERVKQLSQSIDSQSVVITFHPHPRLVAQPNDKSVVLLNSIEEKVELLQKYGIDIIVVVPFTKAFSEQTPEAYIENLLYQKFKPTYIVIGYDHRFGANRVGDTALLQKLAPQYGYEVIEIEKQVIDEIAVSSTKIRQKIEKGNIRSANRLLGHYFSFTGEVVKGQQIGKEIGFPTANIAVTEKNKLLPPHGIYTVFVHLPDGKLRKGMLYRGDRPVLKEHDNVTIEVNIFDFNEDIYGQIIRVELVQYLRPDRYFDSLESLVIQLADDERASREILQDLENQLISRVAIVILNWNTPQYLTQFLPSVCGSRYGNFDVIVADNGSTDDSVEAVRELNLEGIPALMGVDRVRVVELPKNYGFAKGYNEALKHDLLRPRSEDVPKGYDYYVLLNSDCRVSQGWMTPIIEMMDADKTIAAAQPKSLSYNRKRKFEYAGAAGGWIDTLGYPFSRGRVFEEIEKDRKQYDDEAEIFWASGAAMVVRADLWHRFGGFDTDFWAHMEEIDVCWRFKRAGYKVMVQPKGVVRHVGGGTMDYMSPRKSYLNFRNSLYTILKNESTAKLFWLIPTRLLLDGVAGVKFLFGGQFKHILSILKAHFSFYGDFFYMLKKRKEVAQLIEKERIAPNNTAGILRGSIVWQYYVSKKKTFSELINGKVNKSNPIVEDESE